MRPDFAGRCTCCECQGIHCLMPHPGHSHRVLDAFDAMLEVLARPWPEPRARRSYFAFGRVDWWHVPAPPAKPWPPDTRTPEPPRLSLDLFFTLHQQDVVRRLDGYALALKRQQLVEEKRWGTWDAWSKVARDAAPADVARNMVPYRTTWERGMS